MTPTGTHDPDSELALPLFEDALWSALRTERRRVHRSGLRRRVLAAAAAVAVLAGIGVVLAAQGTDDETTIAGPSTESTTTVPETVEERASAAMAAVAESSVVLTESRRDGVLVEREWVDGLTWAQRTEWYDATGRPTAGQGPQRLSTEEDPSPIWAVNHCTREYFELGAVGSSSVLAWLGPDLAAGAQVVDGTEVIDGRELIRVRGWIEDQMPPPDPASGRIRERPRADQLEQRMAHYLDPETLLPVAVKYDIGTPEEMVGTISILPRDEAVDQLVTVVPDGYAEVQQGAWSTPTVGPAGC